MNTRATKKGDRDVVRIDLTKNRLHSLVDVAAFLNAGYNSVQRWIKTGYINTSRDDEGWYVITTAELRRIMKEWKDK